MSGKTVLLGLFDGLHTGHMSAVNALLGCPGEKLVFTFNSAGMTSKGERGLLMSDAEKRTRLLSLGVDRVISREFSELKELSPEEFVRTILRKKLGATAVISGENFRFGRGGAADANELRRLCEDCGMSCITVPTLYSGGEPVSTTRIRRLIESGDISEANRLLGYRYSFTGTVTHGNRIGRSIGIRTVNIPIERGRAVPKYGVYATEVTLDGSSYPGVTNIGLRPTVGDLSEPVIETHLLGFGGDVYGQSVRVALTEFLREEKRFGGLDELRATVAGDINRVKEIFQL